MKKLLKVTLAALLLAAGAAGIVEAAGWSDIYGGMNIGSYAGTVVPPTNGLDVSGVVALGTSAPSGSSELTVSGSSQLNGAVNFLAGRVGTFVCTGGGSITVTNANIAATSAVIISLNTAGGTIATPPAMKTLTAGTSFVALCSASDTSTYNYVILN